MQSSEKRYFVRIMIVGKKSTEKTCLLRRLLKEDISDVPSTDGVDIVVRRCKINIEDGKWIVEKDIDDNKVSRKRRAITTIDAKVDIDKNDDTSEFSSLIMPDNFTTDTKVNLEKNEDTNYKAQKESSSLLIPENLMSNVFFKSTVNTPSNPNALCELLDFAGKKEFYATHQAFLTSCAVYLVVADMKDDISKQGLSQCFANFQNIGEYIEFWFDSIHCHRKTDQPARYGHFDPPILLVFTGKDKYNEADMKKREKELNNQIDRVLGYQSKYRHLHRSFYLSNIIDTDEEFEKLRYAIYETASNMENWGKSFPCKWILLEHLIEINKNDGTNVITMNDMFKLAKHPDINILKTEDLLLFLRFQHNRGNIIFFENVPDLIILRPQWLADAFRCLVSDRFDNSRLHHREDWTLFTRQGLISEALLTELFQSKDGSRFSGQKNNLHAVLEKLDILVKIDNSNYIMPSMMPSAKYEDVCEQFGILTEICKRTSWLCFKFEFLPPSFLNHLSAWFIRKYALSKVDSGTALYRGICIFDIDGSGCVKILVTMSTDTIALQVLAFSEQHEEFGSPCSDIYSEVTQLVDDIKQKYRLKISFKLHFKCSGGYYYKDTFEYERLKRETECFCPQHHTAHRSELLYLPWMKNDVCFF
ncbi:probable serine/threonine-protein kinase roco8 [Mytilus californianus]|uniref:probable serine/threonine-protein kinase roco8 n=1 Tax=Mytilus californianus TaxID=6549 RepID=UPI002246B0B7|nr:probable serine/threonine-protein kinase roco8 [Mytilus californianus]